MYPRLIAVSEHHYRQLELGQKRTPKHRPLTRYIPAPVLTQSFERTTHPAAQWYPDAALGLFLHWGISSVHGSIDLSWGMMADTPWQTNHKITPVEYFSLADRVHPQRYRPHHWLEAAKRAGFRYAVLTARHEDGYTMWPSEYGSFGTQTHFDGVDLLAPFVEACRAVGLKVGFYYSADGWYENKDVMSFSYHSTGRDDRPHRGINHEVIDLPEKPKGWRGALNSIAAGQIRELCTRYGPIDLLWFSGGPEVISLQELRRLQPGIVLNSRMHGCGDFETPEGVMPYDRPDDYTWWERCDMWDPPGWGFHAIQHVRSTGWILSLLAEVRSWHGNFLVSWAPGPDGEMIDEYYSRLAELEGWMKYSAESVFGCSGGPYPDRCNVPATVRDNIAYLHFCSPDIRTARLVDVSRPQEACLLRTGQEISFSYSRRTLIMDHPANRPNELDEVVRVTF